MLFRPTYCAKCGERIERTEWRLWTSRRFCQVCETEHKLQDILAQGVVAAGAICAVVTGVSLISGSREPKKQLTSQSSAARPVALASAGNNAPQIPKPEPPAAPAEPASQAKQKIQAADVQTTSSMSPVAAVRSESAYFCGAETRKGTPCSRRVKGNVRCWQHYGMQAMLPAKDLRLQ